MNLQITSKQTQITEAVETHFARKLQRLEKYFGQECDILVICKKEKGQDRVELTLRSGTVVLRAEDQAGDLYSALDLVSERLERQIEKYKTRLDAKKRDRESIRRMPAPASPEEIEALAEEAARTDLPRIVRSKTFALKPIDTEEACEQMEMLGHNFFVFLNADTDTINVVYRRNDGNYGLIEPELG